MKNETLKNSNNNHCLASFQIDMGEYNSEKGRGSGSGGGNPHHQVLQALDKFYPYRYKDGLTAEELKQV